jgi:hypothetical protein
MSVRKSTGKFLLAPGNPVLWMENATHLSVSFFSECSLEKVQLILDSFIVSQSFDPVNRAREHGLLVGRVVM